MLREYIQFSNGKPLESQIDTNGDVNLITLDSVDISGKLKHIHKKLKKSNGSLSPGDIVTVLSTVVADLNQGNLLGMSAIIPSDGNQYVLNQRMGRIRVVNGSLRSDFLRLCLNASRKHFAERAQGTSQKHIYARDFFSLPIYIPPLEEQKAIAEVLSDVDELIAQTERLIAKKEAIKLGVMQELMRPKDGWIKTKLSKLLSFEQPTKYLVSNSVYSNNYETPVLTAGKTFILGYTDETDNQFNELPVIIFDDFTTSSRLVDFPFKVKSSAIKFLKPLNAEVNLQFVYCILSLLRFEVKDHKRHWISEYRNLSVYVPRIDEQNRIATIVEDLEMEIKIHRSKLDKIITLKDGISSQLLSGKTRLV